MPVSITPTLSSTAGYLVDVRDQVSTFIRFLIMNPGGTSDLWENSLVSFRYLSSKDEHDRDKFCGILKSRVQDILRRKFFDYSFDIDFTSEDYDTNSSRYTIRFSINITGGNVKSEPAFISGHVTVDKTTNDISLIYDKSVDTTMLSGESYE